jgi:hypothetical protein
MMPPRLVDERREMKERIPVWRKNPKGKMASKLGSRLWKEKFAILAALIVICQRMLVVL